MDKNPVLSLRILKRYSVILDLLIPVALYYSLTLQFPFIPWISLGIVTMTRIALVIITK